MLGMIDQNDQFPKASNTNPKILPVKLKIFTDVKPVKYNVLLSEIVGVVDKLTTIDEYFRMKEKFINSNYRHKWQWISNLPKDWKDFGEIKLVQIEPSQFYVLLGIERISILKQFHHVVEISAIVSDYSIQWNNIQYRSKFDKVNKRSRFRPSGIQKKEP